jgi:hypothetical protein
LKGTKDVKLVIGKGGTSPWEEKDFQTRMVLTGYCDADGNSQEHRHAISGYVFCLDGGAISWNSRK